MKTTIVFFVLCFCLTAGFAQEGSITVSVNDIKSEGQGEVVFMLFNKDDGFPGERNKAYKMMSVKGFGSSASHTFNNVPYGSYAVSVYQDKDLDGEIKENFVGIPKEPVGASNLTKMGKPKFKECLFTFDSSSKEIKVKFVVANN